MNIFKRTCSQGHTTTYNNEKYYLKALKKGKCKYCSLQERANEQRGIKKGSDYSLFNIWKKKYGEDIAKQKSNERKEKLSKAQKKFLRTKEGKKVLIKAGEASKNLKETWRKKGFTEDEIIFKLKEIKRKKSEASSGERNPMYGKPVPKKSGNGWKGYYRGIFFSSIKELDYIYFLCKKNISFKRCDAIGLKFPYIMNGVKRNYFPDFFIANKYVVEIKPKRLMNSYQNEIKFLYASNECKKRNFIFKIKDAKFLSDNIIKQMYNEGEIKFTKKYEQRYLDYVNSGKKINRDKL